MAKMTVQVRHGDGSIAHEEDVSSREEAIRVAESVYDRLSLVYASVFVLTGQRRAAGADQELRSLDREAPLASTAQIGHLDVRGRFHALTHSE